MVKLFRLKSISIFLIYYKTNRAKRSVVNS